MDLKQFKKEVLPLRAQLLGFARRSLSDDAEAEDAAQEAMLRLWTCRERLTDCDHIGGFAMQTVKHICIDKLRQRTIRMEIGEADGASGQTPYELMELQDAVTLVERIIDKLPGLQRQIIRMRDIEGYELGEIATITGTKVDAVSMNLSRARKKVREKFLEIQSYKKTMTVWNENDNYG